MKGKKKRRKKVMKKIKILTEREGKKTKEGEKRGRYEEIEISKRNKKSIKPFFLPHLRSANNSLHQRRSSLVVSDDRHRRR